MWLGVASPPPLNLWTLAGALAALVNPSLPQCTGNLGVCCQRRDTELEKALGPQANEDIEKELQALSKSTRIHCS